MLKREAAQHSVHLTAGTLRVLEVILSYGKFPFPSLFLPSRTPKGHNGNRWAYRFELETSPTRTVRYYLGGAIDPRRAECLKLKP